MASALTAGHHAVIQAFMSRGPFRNADAKRLVQEAIENDGQLFDSQLNKINRALGPLQMEIRRGVNQGDGSLWYAIVNRAADDQSKLGTEYSHTQIQLFAAMVRHIALNSGGSGTMSSIEVHNLVLQPAEAEGAGSLGSQRVAAPKALTGVEKERTVEQLAKDKWLDYCISNDADEEEGRRGRARSNSRSGLKLGVRSYLELRQYLRSIEGVALCESCNDAAIEAQMCATDDCGCCIHYHCEQQVFGSTQNPKCPSCSSPWQRAQVEAEPRASDRSGSSAGGGKRRRVKQDK